MILDSDSDQVVASFARHETFHPRHGWLRKAYEAASLGPDTFARSDATVELGVGKNMVNAIRYWGLAFDLLEEAHLPGRARYSLLEASPLADVIFGSDGWDPYLEDPASLWLLHWRLLRPRCTAPVWWLVFNAFDAVQFTEEQLLHFVEEQVASKPEWANIASGSLKKDVDCLLRMYAPLQARARRGVIEDALDCPFRELGLIEPVVGEARRYRWVHGPKATLAPEVVAHASIDYMLREGGGSTISLSRLVTSVGSPGRVFKLTEVALYEALSAAAGQIAEIKVTNPAGIHQLALLSSDPHLPARVLESYYERAAGSRKKLTERPSLSTVQPQLLGLKEQAAVMSRPGPSRRARPTAKRVEEGGARR